MPLFFLLLAFFSRWKLDSIIEKDTNGANGISEVRLKSEPASWLKG